MAYKIDTGIFSQSLQWLTLGKKNFELSIFDSFNWTGTLSESCEML